MEIKNNKLIKVNNEDIINGTFEIPNNVEIIGSNAFFYCFNLENINIPNNITSIEEYAFFHCTNLKNINIDNKIKSIGECAFRECYKLETFKIPNDVTMIKKSTFEDCSNLSNIILSNNISKIGLYTFYGCNKLKKITVSENTIYTNLNEICKEIKNQTNNNISITMNTSLFNVIDSISESNLSNRFGKPEYIINDIFINNKQIDLKKLKKSFKIKKLNDKKIIYNTYIDEIRKEELLDIICKELKRNNFNDKKLFSDLEHKDVIDNVINNLNSSNNYDYRNDINKYIECYIEKTKENIIPTNIINNHKNKITFEIKDNLDYYNKINNNNDTYIDISNIESDLETYLMYIYNTFYNNLTEFHKKFNILKIKQGFCELPDNKNDNSSKNKSLKSNNINSNIKFKNLNNLINEEIAIYKNECEFINELKELINLYEKSLSNIIKYLLNLINTNSDEKNNLLINKEKIKNIKNIITETKVISDQINITLNTTSINIYKLNFIKSKFLPNLQSKLLNNDSDINNSFTEIYRKIDDIINNQNNIISNIEEYNSLINNDTKNKQFYKKL